MRNMAALTADRLVDAATAQLGGKVVDYSPAIGPTSSVKITVLVSTGDRRTAYLDPYDGRVLGTTRAGGVMQIVRDVHSLRILGFWGAALIEIAAGWSIILVVSGLYLWWPQRQLRLRGSPGKRLFWRDLHSSTGVLATVMVLSPGRPGIFYPLVGLSFLVGLGLDFVYLRLRGR